MKRQPAVCRRACCLFVLCVPALLTGCAAAVVGAGAAAGATGVAASQDRRTAGTMLDDELIEDKALDAVYHDQELWNQSHLNITSYNNVVLLTGETPTPELRARAEKIVLGIPKVRQVHNEITISAPSSMLSRSSDSWITSKVKTSMLTNDNVPATRIKVVTENGIVYLMGLVTRAEGDAATDVARQVSGVQRVVKLFEYVKG